MAETLRSSHETDSNRMQLNRPPLGNKSPNSRAANRARNGERERVEEGGGREEEEEEQGSALSGRKEAKEGKRKRGEGLKKAPSTQG